jgi:hypothetical protein
MVVSKVNSLLVVIKIKYSLVNVHTIILKEGLNRLFDYP